jgi:hypothetical protein
MDVEGGQDVENRNIIVWNKHEKSTSNGTLSMLMNIQLNQ